METRDLRPLLVTFCSLRCTFVSSLLLGACDCLHLLSLTSHMGLCGNSVLRCPHVCNHTAICFGQVTWGMATAAGTTQAPIRVFANPQLFEGHKKKGYHPENQLRSHMCPFCREISAAPANPQKAQTREVSGWVDE